MKIWHLGAASSPFRIDGVSRTVWLLSREQARLGHQVSIIIDTPPDQAATDIAREAGMQLVHVQATWKNYASEIRKIIERDPPDIVHMHSVFVVRQATMAGVLREMGIPYVITPHAGLAPQVLRRGIVKKTVYTLLRERPRFLNAAAITLVTPAEERAVRSFIPHYRRPIRWIPNPVETDKLDPYRWEGVQDSKRVVFLGRFDVLVKGIDILIEIARLLPEVQIDLYGTEDPKTLDKLNELKQTLPANVAFHEPIFSCDKARMLAGASLYLQPSRWEGFPVSVAECLYLGVPSAIADTLDLAQLFFKHDLGLVVPLDPPRAAAQIRAALANEENLRQWSKRGREFAIENFIPAAAAQRHVDLYNDVLAIRARREGIFVPSGNGAGSVANGNGNGHVNGNGHGNGHVVKPWQFMPANLRASMKLNMSRMVERTNRVLGTPEQPRTIVLCYHSINRSHADLSIDPLVFRAQLTALREMGYEFVNFGDLVHRVMRFGPPKNHVACITFDDGYEDNLTQAAPILSDLDVPATVFITTGLLQRDPSIVDYFHNLTRYDAAPLSEAQVRELSEMGIEIGAHTHTHANMARLSLQRTREEIVRCKSILEDVCGKRVRSFAYPFGKRNIHYTQMTVGVVRESGFVGAAAVAFRAVNASESIRIFEVPRFFVTRADSHDSFLQKVKGHFDWLGSIQEQTPAWLKAKVSPEDSY